MSETEIKNIDWVEIHDHSPENMNGEKATLYDSDVERFGGKSGLKEAYNSMLIKMVYLLQQPEVD